MPASPLQVEVRLITYKRPALLRRALESLLAQTHPHWKAVVFDDSPLREAEAVVHELGDDRIRYSPNPVNLGMIKNLSQAFSPGRYFEGSAYATILEDDNLFEPGLLAANVAALQASGLPVMVRNFRVVEIAEDGVITPTPAQPMRDLYGPVARPIPLDERAVQAFHNYSLATMAYFWDLGRGIDLSIPYELNNGPVSEGCRAVSFAESCWYEPGPHAVFSRFVAKHQTPRRERHDGTRGQRLGRLSRIRLTKALYAHARKKMKLSFAEILATAPTSVQRHAMLFHLAEAGVLRALLHLRDAQTWFDVLKALPLNFFYAQEHLRKSREAAGDFTVCAAEKPDARPTRPA